MKVLSFIARGGRTYSSSVQRSQNVLRGSERDDEHRFIFDMIVILSGSIYNIGPDLGNKMLDLWLSFGIVSPVIGQCGS